MISYSRRKESVCVSERVSLHARDNPGLWGKQINAGQSLRNQCCKILFHPMNYNGT